MAVFHDMFDQMIEFYVDDLVVKSKEKAHHLQDLRKVFDRCRLYKLKMNPLKFALDIVSGKFLGCIFHHQGIEPDPAKSQAIVEMPRSASLKELKAFLGNVYFLRRFIPALAKILYPFSALL